MQTILRTTINGTPHRYLTTLPQSRFRQLQKLSERRGETINRLLNEAVERFIDGDVRDAVFRRKMVVK